MKKWPKPHSLESASSFCGQKFLCFYSKTNAGGGEEGGKMFVFRNKTYSTSFSILTGNTLHFPTVIILKRCHVLTRSIVAFKKLYIISVIWREERYRMQKGQRENLRRNTLALRKQQLKGTTMWKLICVTWGVYLFSLHLKTSASIKTLTVAISTISNKLHKFAIHCLIDTSLNRRYLILT